MADRFQIQEGEQQYDLLILDYVMLDENDELPTLLFVAYTDSEQQEKHVRAMVYALNKDANRFDEGMNLAENAKGPPLNES